MLYAAMFYKFLYLGVKIQGTVRHIKMMLVLGACVTLWSEPQYGER
jgi:hypothetical protein